MSLLSQREIELQMYRGGIERADRSMANAEKAGQAVRNPYAAEILRDYVLPLARVIEVDREAGRVGQRAAHIVLLNVLDAEGIAYLAVRAAICFLLDGQKEHHHRKLGYALGLAVHNELVLDQIADENPALYHTLSNDLGRRHSKSERHRLTVMKMQAKKNEVSVIEWPIGAREQVGFYLMDIMQQAGLIEIGETENGVGYKRGYKPVFLAGDILARVAQIKSFVGLTMPSYGPCVEPPVDWTACDKGGFHTPEVQRAARWCVRAHSSARDLYRDMDAPIFFKAINHLQKTAWAVNTKILAVIEQSAMAFATKEIASSIETPKPPRPTFFDIDKDLWTELQHTEFIKWKAETRDWHTERKLLVTRFSRFGSAIRTAQAFRDYPEIYFVYFADSRGRFYPRTYGLSPQGSDLQKALLHAAYGKPVNTPDAIKWFHVQGANKFGFDKAPLADRHKWVVDRQDLILSFADDPINNQGWTEADKPLQFLAWCFEYADYVRDTTGSFISRIPISMDGSCNGLQNLSALLRDSVGGRATNLTANEVMEDIYRRVAEAATARLLSKSTRTDIENKWVAHGISRSAVKRSVMTTPYGVTRTSAQEYVISDYLAEGEAKCFDKAEYREAAKALMDVVWPAIGDVVVKGREAMDYLRKSSREIIKKLGPDAEPLIHWTTPSGFVATQTYYEAKIHRIVTRLAGRQAIRVLSETDDPDPTRHASGMAPNFVHSLDAAHLHITTAAAAESGIDFMAMIHDDYGTLAADSQKLYDLIRTSFVKMYEEHAPLEEFQKQYDLKPIPKMGDLDIREVLKSEYFFS